MLITLEEIRELAFDAHHQVNHTYGSLPYSFHLQKVFEVGVNFIHLVPQEMRFQVLGACYLHDIIEDARYTYNDVKDVVGESIADMVYALTNEKGKTRSTRANDKYYAEMKLQTGAVFVKLCDRIANMEHSKSRGSDMIEKYREELPSFKARLYTPEYQEMFDYLDAI